MPGRNGLFRVCFALAVPTVQQSAAQLGILEPSVDGARVGLDVTVLCAPRCHALTVHAQRSGMRRLDCLAL